MYMYFFVETETPTLTQLTDQSWVWLTDLERSCALLVGQCLGSMLIGEPAVKEETQCHNWLQTPIFSQGLVSTGSATELEMVHLISHYVVKRQYHMISAEMDRLPMRSRIYLKHALNLQCDVDEALYAEGEHFEFYDALLEHAEIKPWECPTEEEELLETVTRCFLIALLKHAGLLQKSVGHVYIKEVFNFALNLRQKILSTGEKVEKKDDGELDGEKEEEEEEDKEEDYGDEFKESGGNFRMVNFCYKLLQRCLFVLLFVKGAYFLIGLLNANTKFTFTLLSVCTLH